MVRILYHACHLLLLLIAFNIVHIEAGKIKPQKTSLEVRNVSENVNFNDEKLLKSSEVVLKVEPPQTHAVATQGSRESKYSYFYIGRWTWHIPLWFTLWFSFYVFFNVIRSIYGHTINPDDYARRKREIRNSPSDEDIDRITNLAIKSFEKFKNKKR